MCFFGSIIQCIEYNFIGDKMFKKILAIILSIFTIVETKQIVGVRLPEDNQEIMVFKPGIKPNIKSSVLIDANTNKVLVDNRKDARLPMASMTKVMSLIIFFEAIEEKRLQMDQLLTCSENAASKGGSQIFLSVGEQMSVDDLLKSVCIASANDATVVLAEAISGSEEVFVQLMNKKAEELKLYNTVFSNSTGLPTTNAHYTTAYDMAIMSSYLINNYPKALEYSSKYEDYVRVGTPKQFWLVNTNKLIKSVEGIDGLKTGWTEDAGYCLTCTKKVDNMRLVSVVMGANTIKDRTNMTLELLNYGFSNYKYQMVLPKGTIVNTNKNILLSPTEQNVVLSKDFGILLQHNEEFKNYQTKIVIDNDLINRYETKDIGYIEFYKDGNLIDKISLDLQTTTKKTTFLDLFKEVLKYSFIYG